MSLTERLHQMYVMFSPGAERERTDLKDQTQTAAKRPDLRVRFLQQNLPLNAHVCTETREKAFLSEPEPTAEPELLTDP